MSDRFALRPYQARAFSRIMEEFEAGRRSTLLVLPTGCGKTVTFGTVARHVIDDLGGRVLVLAHRGELLDQAANALAGLGLESAIEKAEQDAKASLFGDASCVIGSVQTLQRRRLLSWPRGHFKLVITDEAHHAAAESYQKIYRHLDPDWHLGVTATPDRLDGENLGQVYSSLAFEYSLREAITSGFLSRLKVVRCETSVDLGAIRTTGGDLNQGDVEEAIRPHIEELANATRQEIGNRRTIVFTPDVGSGQAFASALKSMGISAASIHGDTGNRAEVLDGFRRGATRVLCNCALLTEGFDAPFVSAIVLARPTRSRALYSQMAGRGTRLAPNKEDCLLVDFAWLTGKHDLVKATELFDTTGADPEVFAIAEELLAKGETDDLMAAIERGEREKVERQALRVKVREREARYRRVAYDPLAVGDILGLNLRPESDAALKHRATPGQVRALTKFGIQGAAEMSKKRASLYMDRLIEDVKLGRATVKQKAHLIANGVDPAEARTMPIAEASSRLDVIFNRGRRLQHA